MVSTSHMNWNTSINELQLLGVRGIPRDLYERIKPIKFEIDVIDSKGRFVNLLGYFSPLCGVPWELFSKCSKAVTK